ncbi:unannotated protein [freshwater metagenome]|uniref:Unannotated protein n=1 Tax=freshwater metagenome TaxID=449393 RepID=A0A6J7S133_9ZZZZ
MLGDRDRLGPVLDDQHGVALVTQSQEQVVHALNVVRMQPRRGFVERIGDIGQRRAEVPDHLHPLSLAARQRSRRSVEGEVAQADLDKRAQRVVQRREQWCDRGLVQALDPGRKIADLHEAGLGDADPSNL